MNLAQYISKIFIVPALVSTLMLTIYWLSSIEKNKSAEFADHKYLFLFLAGVCWFNVVFPLYFNSLAERLGNYESLLIILYALCTFILGFLLSRFKSNYPVPYGMIEIFFGGIALTALTLFKAKLLNDVYLEPVLSVLFPTIGYLYVIVRGIENIEKNVKQADRL